MTVKYPTIDAAGFLLHSFFENLHPGNYIQRVLRIQFIQLLSNIFSKDDEILRLGMSHHIIIIPAVLIENHKELWEHADPQNENLLLLL